VAVAKTRRGALDLALAGEGVLAGEAVGELGRHSVKHRLPGAGADLGEGRADLLATIRWYIGQPLIQ
jgi:hypothetical protein